METIMALSISHSLSVTCCGLRYEIMLENPYKLLRCREEVFHVIGERNMIAGSNFGHFCAHLISS